MTKITLRRFAFAIMAVALLAVDASAAQPLFARSAIERHWIGFQEYWGGAFKSQSAITMIVIGTGLVSMFIITRAKWRK